jgi:hypothetical protein
MLGDEIIPAGADGTPATQQVELPLVFRRDSTTDPVHQAQCVNVRERALTKIHEIEHKMRALQAMHTALTRLVAACAGQGYVTDCPILESLDADKHASTYQEVLS